jgi:hypothetical protein
MPQRKDKEPVRKHSACSNCVINDGAKSEQEFDKTHTAAAAAAARPNYSSHTGAQSEAINFVGCSAKMNLHTHTQKESLIHSGAQALPLLRPL